MNQLIPVTTAPMFDPGVGRVDLRLEPGLTLAGIVAVALPGLSDRDSAQVRIVLVTPRASEVIEQRYWHRIRPRPGVHVVIRVIPAEGALRSILTIVVAVAAVALGAVFGPALGAALGISAASGTALVTAGVTMLGNLLVNALIPPPEPQEAKPTFSISGWRNQLQPDGAVPVVLGTIRYAPPFAAMSYSEIVGDWQYIRSVFNFGYGPLDLTDFRIGETSLSEYNAVEIEVRDGYPDDMPVSFYPRQIVEETIGTELTRPFPRDELGEIVDGPTIETPITRTTGADAAGASVIFAFPAGLVYFDKKGRPGTEFVVIRIEQRLVEAEEWQLVETLDIRAQKLEAFYRQYTWEFPSRGRYEVRITSETDETTNSSVSRRVSWAALQTLRPEYPLNFNHPLALVSVRIKATHQLSGGLDRFNAVASRICLDYDHLTNAWVERVTSNPAALYRYVLQSPANPKPVGDAAIDLVQLADWHDFCRIKGLKYDRVQDSSDSTLRDVLTEIAGAGRASPRHDGIRWGVTIDRPQELVIDHINPRNSQQFKVRRQYFDPPHAIRVKFQDATNDYQDAERLVRWPGYAGEITLTEALEMPGKTGPDEIYRETRRRMYEALYRPDSYQVMQDGPARVATRGDLIMLSHDVLDRVQMAARVRAVVGRLLEIDEYVMMEEGQSYGVRFRVFAETAPHVAPDTIGTSVVCPLLFDEGETRLLTLDGDGPMPMAGDLIHFGLLASESVALIVQGVEAGEDMASLFRLIDAAPIIDELTDAEVIPPWSGRVGAEIPENLIAPPAPLWAGVTSGVSGTADANLLNYLILPGTGPVATSRIEVEHRLTGAPGWTVIDRPVASGGGSITSYVAGNSVQLRARARSATNVPGPYTPTITVVVGSADLAIPAALDAASVTAVGGMGVTRLTWATGSDAAITQVQVYRAPAGTPLDRALHAVRLPVLVTPGSTFGYVDGDATRTTLITNGDFASGASGWTLDAHWSVTGGQAVHSPTGNDAILTPATLSAGKWYRLAYTIAGLTAGSIRPRLFGGTERLGVAVTANGQFRDRIQAVTGNTSLRFLAAATFDGSLDDVVLFEETTACLASGMYDYYLEPQNDDAVPGPVSGPFAASVM